MATVSLSDVKASEEDIRWSEPIDLYRIMVEGETVFWTEDKDEADRMLKQVIATIRLHRVRA